MAQRKTEKRRRGRPPSPPETVRRNEVHVMFTDGEMIDLGRLATDAGLPLGTFLHGLVKRTLNRRKTTG